VMTDAVVMASKRRIEMVSLETWRTMLSLVDGPDKVENEQLLFYGWHIILGQPAVLTHRATSRH
jgi:hypothetical protein